MRIKDASVGRTFLRRYMVLCVRGFLLLSGLGFRFTVVISVKFNLTFSQKLSIFAGLLRPLISQVLISSISQ